MVYSEDDALEILTSAGCYWVVNWRLVQFCRGFEEAVILGYLCSLQNYWTSNNQLKDGMFYCTAETMKEQTTIEPRQQRKAIKNLIDIGLIETRNMGLPQKRYFKVNTKRLKEVFLENPDDNEL